MLRFSEDGRNWRKFSRLKYKENGAVEGIRTPDPRITNAVLYQLSYDSAAKRLEPNAWARRINYP
jgi:hypothetical protein